MVSLSLNTIRWFIISWSTKCKGSIVNFFRPTTYDLLSSSFLRMNGCWEWWQKSLVTNYNIDYEPNQSRHRLYAHISTYMILAVCTRACVCVCVCFCESDQTVLATNRFDDILRSGHFNCSFTQLRRHSVSCVSNLRLQVSLICILDKYGAKNNGCSPIYNPLCGYWLSGNPVFSRCPKCPCCASCKKSVLKTTSSIHMFLEDLRLDFTHAVHFLSANWNKKQMNFSTSLNHVHDAFILNR